MSALARIFGRYAPQWLVEWYLEKRHGIRPFKAGVIEWNESGDTEMVIRDEPIVWHQWGKEGVELGYNFNGALTAIRVPGRLMNRPAAAEESLRERGLVRDGQNATYIPDSDELDGVETMYGPVAIIQIKEPTA